MEVFAWSFVVKRRQDRHVIDRPTAWCLVNHQAQIEEDALTISRAPIDLELRCERNDLLGVLGE